MRFIARYKSLLMSAALAASSLHAIAGAKFEFGEDQYLTFGAATRYTYARAERPAAAGGGHANDPNLSSARLYFGASLNQVLKATFHTEWDSVAERVKVLDLFARLELMPEFNIWAGRLVSPSDRANMVGAYDSVGGGYWPCVSSRYGCNGGIFLARDDGAVVWGNVAAGRLGYSIGAFEGRTFGVGALNEFQARQAGIDIANSLMYSGRLQYDFWDLETGYFSSADHLGKAEILAVGVAFRYQKDGVVTLANTGDYTGYNLDFQLETRIAGAGALGLEAAYYDYDTDSAVLGEQGQAYSAGVSYLYNQKIGWGQLQPFVHWQRFDADNRVTTQQLDLGLNYVIDGHDAQISATYSHNKVNQGGENLNRFVVALQLQY